MSMEMSLKDAISYWKSVAEAIKSARGSERSTSEAGGFSGSFADLLADIPEPSPDLTRTREFVDIGLQAAEDGGGYAPLITWCILAGHVTLRRSAVRLLSQMSVKTPGDLMVQGAASLILGRVILPLVVKFRKDIIRPALILAADICESVREIEERQELSVHLAGLLSHVSTAAKRRRFSPKLFVDLVGALASSDRMREAEAVARIGLMYFPHVPELLIHRAERGIGESIFERQPSELERMIMLFPDRPEFRRKHAYNLVEREEYAKAIHDMRAYLDLVPDDVEFRSNYAHTLAMNYRPIEALEEFTTLVEVEPEEAKHYLGRARIYDQLEMTERAIEDYTRSLEIDPGLIEASIGREQSLMKRQALGMDDDVYSAFLSGGEEKFIGEHQIPSESFADIAGLESVKETIRETIKYPITHPELSEKYGKRAGGGMLFFGPPGCGKTILARAAAGECSIPFISVSLSSVLDKWVGNSEKAIAMIFKVARKNTPSMIFFDELDSLGMAREETQTGWEKKIISQLLTEMDGTSSDNRNVLILGATNAPWNVDHALRRAGRFGKSVFVQPPDVKERTAIFKLYLERKPLVDKDGIDCDVLAEKTEFHSSDCIRQIVEDAATIPWKEAIRTGKSRPIEMADILKAIQDRQPDLVEWNKLVSRYEEFARQTAIKPVIGFRSTRAKPQGV